MIKVLWEDRKTLWELSKNDRKARYASSILGVTWTIIQPLINMLVIWLVFQVGFKSSNLADNTPFIVWYMPAFLIWNFFQEACSQSSGSLIEYSYLVKKVNFNIEIIPVIKILSNAIIHLFFMGFIVIVNLCYGRMPSLFYFQAFYYFFCAAAFALAVGLVCAAIAPFASDIMNIVAVVIQIGFWVTPIFWDPTNMVPFVKFLLKLNPMYYVCMGYRDSFIYGIPFFHHINLSVYFWVVTITIWLVGVRLFKKAKPHLDDVL